MSNHPHPCAHPDAHSPARRALITAAGIVALAAARRLAFAQMPERVVQVVARKFVFEPEEIHVQRGETVMLQFMAPEVPMGFSLPEFAMRADIVPGRVSTLRLTPDKAGRFGFLCDVFCGSGHEEMGGSLIVS